MTKPMQTNKEFMARVIQRTAAGRVGTPDDLAGIGAFLSPGRRWGALGRSQ
jgi:hypothetical protein